MRKISLFAILLIFLNPFLVFATSDIYQVESSDDDFYINEVGTVFQDSFFVRVKDRDGYIIAMLRFQNLSIDRNDLINEAILSVRTTGSPGTFLSSLSATIYGVEGDCPDFSNPASAIGFSQTTQNVVWNISQLYGTGWHNITITNVVNEAINNYGWTGNTTDQNSSLGLKILSTQYAGALGVRDFVSYDMWDQLGARLYITYEEIPNVPPGIPPDAIYNQTRGNATIWVSNQTWQWLNFTEMTLRVDDASLTVHNSTHLEMNHHDDAGNDGLNVNITDAPLDRIQKRFILNVSLLQDASGAETGLVWMLIGFDDDYDWRWESTEAIVGLLIEHQGGPQWRVRFYGRYATGGGWSDGLAPWYSLANFRNRYDGTYWDVIFDRTTGLYQYRVWNHSDFKSSHLVESFGWFSVNKLNNISQMSYWMVQDQPMREPETWQDWGDGWMISNTSITEGEAGWYSTNPNCTGPFDSLDDLLECLEEDAPDPYDPDPPGWPTSGPFTRFRWRLYFFILGYFMIFGSGAFIAWRKGNQFLYLVALFLMLIGWSFWLVIPTI